MLIKVSDRLIHVSTGRVTLLALVIFLLFSALVLPSQSAQTDAELGDVGSPDLSLWYSAGDLYEFADTYGAEGRAAYIRSRFTFDVVWPLVYTLFLGTALSWTVKTAFPPASYWRLTNLFPPMGMVFDYLENMATSLVMARFPDQTVIIDQLAPVFTLSKWILIGMSFVLLLVTLALGVQLWFRRWTDRPNHNG